MSSTRLASLCLSVWHFHGFPTGTYPSLFQHWAVRVVWPVLAAATFLILIGVCVSLDAPTSYPFYEQDISAYGFIGTPGYGLFVACFVLTPMILVVGAYVRHHQLLQHVPYEHRSFALSYSRACLMIILGSWASLVVMAVTDGWNDQIPHFPAALLGIGLLAIYDFLHAYLSSFVLVRQHANAEANHIRLRSIMAVLYWLTPILTIVFVILWIVQMDSLYEWLAVVMLIAHFLPVSIELGMDLGRERRLTNAGGGSGTSSMELRQAD